MVEIRQTEVYARWFGRLRDRQARVRIDSRIRRMSLGNFGDVRPVGEGVSEIRIDYGPGYRVYYTHREAKPWSSFWLEATKTAKTGTYKEHWSSPEDSRRQLWQRRRLGRGTLLNTLRTMRTWRHT